MSARWIAVAITFVLSLSMFMNRYQVPYFYVAPGPPTNVLSVLKITGVKTYPSAGKLLLTTASVGRQRMNLWDVIQVWLDDNAVAIPERALRDPGQSSAEVDAEGRRDMESSKVTAEVAAFRALGFEVPVVAGAYVLATVDGSGAAEALRAGDVIKRIGSRAIRDQRSISVALKGRKLGDIVVVDFARDGAAKSASLKLKTTLKGTRIPAMGVFVGTVFRFPHDVEIDTGGVIGPSGGLVFALSLADVLSPDDLTRGHIVAVTGTLGYDPSQPLDVVGPIGAIEEKVRGARAIGADIFVAPAENAAAARKEAGTSMTVISVHTLAEAIAQLKSLPLKR